MQKVVCPIWTFSSSRSYAYTLVDDFDIVQDYSCFVHDNMPALSFDKGYAYMHWRYVEEPSHAYLIFSFSGGYLVVKKQNACLYVVDMLYDTTISVHRLHATLRTIAKEH